MGDRDSRVGWTRASPPPAGTLARAQVTLGESPSFCIAEGSGAPGKVDSSPSSFHGERRVSSNLSSRAVGQDGQGSKPGPAVSPQAWGLHPPLLSLLPSSVQRKSNNPASGKMSSIFFLKINNLGLGAKHLGLRPQLLRNPSSASRPPQECSPVGAPCRSFRGKRAEKGMALMLWACLSRRCCEWLRCCGGGEPRPRTVWLGHPEKRDQRYPRNVINNQKYNFFTFLPGVRTGRDHTRCFLPTPNACSGARLRRPRSPREVL